LIDDAQALADTGNPVARIIAQHWEFPLDLMFLDPDGNLITKLNSFKDLRAAHDDVGHPPDRRGRSAPHVDVFMQTVDRHFPQK